MRVFEGLGTAGMEARGVFLERAGPGRQPASALPHFILDGQHPIGTGSWHFTDHLANSSGNVLSGAFVSLAKAFYLRGVFLQKHIGGTRFFHLNVQ